MPTLNRAISELSREQCVELLRDAEIGRVVFTDRAMPAILPTTYIVDGEHVVLRTAAGSRLARAAQGAVLAFEVDDIRPAQREAWSVVVTGQAVIESEPGQLRRLDGLLSAWAPGMRDAFVRIPMTMVSGRHLHA